MLRRALPVLAAAAAAVTLLPATAAAAPVSAPENGSVESFQAHVQLTVPGAQGPGGASLVLNREPGGDRRASLSLTLPAEPCAELFCFRSPRSGWTEISTEQVSFARDLSSATAVDVPITLSTFGFDWQTGSYQTTTEQLTVTLSVTGAGARSTDVQHGDYCGEGSPCQGTHVTASRSATAVLTVPGGPTATGEGALVRGHSVSGAVRPAAPEGPGETPADGSGDVPWDGSGDQPSNGSGDAPADGSGDLSGDGSGEGTPQVSEPSSATATATPTSTESPAPSGD